MNLSYKNNPLTEIVILFLCSMFIFILPIMPITFNWMYVATITLIMLFSASSISKRIIILGTGAIIMKWSTNFSDHFYLNSVAELATNIFIFYLVFSVIVNILKREQVSVYTLIEALNGYLLLSILFISLVSFCDSYIPGAYTVDNMSNIELAYYTIITLTTTGYGDIAPVHPIAKSLSMVISVAGQFYVAVIVAILVGKFTNVFKMK